jgi:HD-GYP domain-containing protein (c-di-GMP phosphodiesterase class II)
LKAVIGLVVVSATAVATLCLGFFPLEQAIGGWTGVAFWSLATAVSSALPVRMPGGAYVNLTIAPIVAAAALGGPSAAVVVAGIGTLEWREVRGLLRTGGVPWYGTLYNHAEAVIPAAASGLVCFAFSAEVQPTAYNLLVVVAAGVSYSAINIFLTAVPIAILENRPLVSNLRASANQFGMSLAGLAPLGWLMAAMYVVAGPIGVLPFAVPLYATRVGYKKVVEIRDMFTQTVRSLAGAIDAKDPFTAGHSERVQLIARDLGEELRCSDAELEALEWGGLLHDVGKIGIPDAILLKEGALTKEERMVMNAHPVKGEEILKPVDKLARELPIIRHHHEWFNGSGYPDRLVGADIPRLARIMHVADSYEAMTAARPYRLTPLSQQQALDELHKFSGIQFDPEVVAAFDELVKQKPAWLKPNIPKHLVEKYIPKLGEPDATPTPA